MRTHVHTTFSRFLVRFIAVYESIEMTATGRHVLVYTTCVDSFLVQRMFT